MMTLVSCSSKPNPVHVSQLSGSASNLYADAEKMAIQKYPKALLIGFNNHGPNSDALARMPPNPDQHGTTSYWHYFFIKTPASLNDHLIKNPEAFGILFNEGVLSFMERVTIHDQIVSPSSSMGNDLLKVDTPDILTKALAKILQDTGESVDIKHIDFNCMLGKCDVIIFKNFDDGYKTQMNPVTGDISTQAIRFERK
jgi:hypothetical protein